MGKLKSFEDAKADLERNGGLKVVSLKLRRDLKQSASPDGAFLGFHQFATNEEGPVVKTGSFEVFHNGRKDGGGDPSVPEGFYWWACFPGCLPDGEPSGPFPTAEGAYLDAIGD